MSEKSTELELYEPFLNRIPNIELDSLNLSNIDTITKSRFAEHFHFFCKKCNTMPYIRLENNNKIKYFCKCTKPPKNLSEIFKYLDYSEVIDFDDEKLK